MKYLTLALLLLSVPSLADDYTLKGKSLRVVEQALTPGNLVACESPPCVGLWSPSSGGNKGKPLWRKEDGTDVDLSTGTWVFSDSSGNGATCSGVGGQCSLRALAGTLFIKNNDSSIAMNFFGSSIGVFNTLKVFGGGLVLPNDQTTFSNPQPTCDDSTANQVWVVDPGPSSGLAADPQICLRDAADAYAWHSLTYAP